MAAFKRSIRSGAPILQADVRYTKDQELIVFADNQVDRLTTGSGTVSDLSLAEIQALTMRNGEKIPTFFDFTKLLEQTRTAAVLTYRGKNEEALIKKFYTAVTDADASIWVLGGREVVEYATANGLAVPTVWAPDPAQGNPTDGKEEKETISGGGTKTVTVKPWPQANNVPRGADVAMVRGKTTQDWVTLMRGGDADVLAYFDAIGPDNANTWAELAKWQVRWIVTSDVPGYQKWSTSGAACAPQPPRAQFVQCFDLAKEPIKRRTRTVVLKAGCQTTALQPIKVGLKTSKKKLAKLIKRKGDILLKTFDKKGKVTITLSSPAGKGYLEYETVHPRGVK
jgi:hypothetical protein